MGDKGHAHPTPYQRLGTMISADSKDLLVLVAYTAMAGLLTLVIPLASQALVGTIAAGVFIQPLVVLTGLVFGGLVFVGVLRLLKFHLVEIMQERIFARVALMISERVIRLRQPAIQEEYAPELLNRFFDVINVQKSVSKILLDGPAAMLQILVGLILMAFYSPILLAFAVFLIVFVIFVITVLGIGGLPTSIQESIQKYKVAGWLEELGRCQTGFKMHSFPGYLMKRTDELVIAYIKARRRHFRVLYRQAAGNYAFNAIAFTGVLGIGGWLVINRQLTLGQLVASELIIVSVLGALDKLIRLLEPFYDLLTGLDKIGHVTDLPLERTGGSTLPYSPKGVEVVCRGVHFSYSNGLPVLANLDLVIEPGERVSLVGASGAGKTTLASLFCGINEPSHGTVDIDGIDVRDLDLTSLREAVDFVGDINEIFDGTLEENIVVGRAGISHEDIRRALDITQFTDDLSQFFPEGLKTSLVSEGRNLSRGQRQRLLIARAIVARPRLLILDEAFTGIDEATKLKILDALYAPENNWTIIDISHDLEVVLRADRVHVLSSGRIVESGSISDLTKKKGGEFLRLFPSLAEEVN